MKNPMATAIAVLGVLVFAFGLVREVQSRLPLNVTPPSVEEQLVYAGVSRDSIPSIDEPEFESIALADTHLSDDGFGIDLAVNGRHRFYPFQILVWHEVVNDDLAGTPVAVTYDPICQSGVVYERTVNGTTYDFGVDGRLLDNNPVYFDRQTNSLWQQATGKAIAGALDGQSMTIYPSTIMTWKEWKEQNESGDVLSRRTGAIRDYTSNPYADSEFVCSASTSSTM